MAYYTIPVFLDTFYKDFITEYMEKGVEYIIIPLTKLPVKKSGFIMVMENEGLIRRRLLDLGFVPGTRIKLLRKSPSGNPRAYLIRGTVIALRKEETDLIFVEVES